MATRRPPLYSMQAGPRRRRRLPAVSPLRAVLVILLVALVAAAAVVVWRVLPLTDRSAGVIPPSALTGVVPQTPGNGTGGVTSPLRAAGASTRALPGVHVAAGIVVDAGSGRVLWSHRPHAHRPIASLTKLMTALLSGRGGINRRFVVTPAMTGETGYTIGLRAGSKVSVRDMLAAMLIASANDAADALAVHTAGSLKAFVRQMNHEARKLKLSDTHYSNPSGIVDAGNDSSAWDVADLSRQVLAVAPLRRLVSSKFYRPATGAPYVNRNELLWTYPDAGGIKTGQTTLAGNCLAASATRGGHTLIAVELGVHGSEFATASRMLDWGFHKVAR
ncbi:MAG TPA: D-alanyl-D-alanine carboxypeptidase family protein [Gaiellales bacterium]|nr:D-alanyl-D-alanine carboxypeptidase family protein [Gaiellales bacterium]